MTYRITQPIILHWDAASLTPDEYLTHISKFFSFFLARPQVLETLLHTYMGMGHKCRVFACFEVSDKPKVWYRYIIYMHARYWLFKVFSQCVLEVSSSIKVFDTSKDLNLKFVGTNINWEYQAFQLVLGWYTSIQRKYENTILVSHQPGIILLVVDHLVHFLVYYGRYVSRLADFLHITISWFLNLA